MTRLQEAEENQLQCENRVKFLEAQCQQERSLILKMIDESDASDDVKRIMSRIVKHIGS